MPKTAYIPIIFLNITQQFDKQFVIIIFEEVGLNVRLMLDVRLAI